MASIEFAVNGSKDPSARYLGWTPSPATLRIVDAEAAAGDVAVRVESPSGTGGRCWVAADRTAPPQETLVLTLPRDGSPVAFWLSGRQASVTDKDASVAVFAADGNNPLLTIDCMVRIRKNAEALSSEERSRFLHALDELNNDGAGPYQSFCDSHVEASLDEAHGLDGFLPWHRAYLLDLERLLQQIDPSATLPYWRFDEPAPTVFSPDFLGQSDQHNQAVALAANNPLKSFSVRDQPFITRVPLFDAANEPGGTKLRPLKREQAVVQDSHWYKRWRFDLEANPHGAAHVSFLGPINNPATAPRDPLFFLLHTNVDRLWARWQWLNRRFDPTKVPAFPNQEAGQARIGHNIPDTMWPWNRDTSPPRPPTVPRAAFTPSGLVGAPGKQPTVGSIIDYQGRFDPSKRLGFDYDDVPFDPFI
jgi:tyrosinase